MVTEKHKRRLALYSQGKNDVEIALAEGSTPETIKSWRSNYRLTSNQDPGICDGGVSLRKALTDEQCESVLGFFARLLREDDDRKRRRVAV